MSHIEITSDVQVGPARLTGRFGTRLDCRDWGHRLFWIEVVYVDGGRLTLRDTRSYEVAIVEAEEAAREWGVHVNDLVEAE